MKRRFPVGAEVREDGIHFRVWAPCRKRVAIVLEAPGENMTISLEAEGNGYFSGLTSTARVGTRYRYQLDGEDTLIPDPVSRYQPEGPHGVSQIVDPSGFAWTDCQWQGLGLQGQTIYEMHIGTFTPEGTWAAAAQQLEELSALGITVLEIMPVAEFPGKFGWGYDGVALFAPTRLYGEPDDFRRFVDQAHSAGLGVILDVVYNHIGPDGNYLRDFSADYFTDRYKNEWGEALNFDGPNSSPVREFFIANAVFWIDEFHLDGLRLDATQQIFDNSKKHILAEIAHAVRAAAGTRKTLLVAENETQEAKLVRSPQNGGYGLDALWNDDFHHTAAVALTGHNPAYYSDYLGHAQEFISAVKWGYLYQGQRYSWQKKRRGTSSLGLSPAHFVTFLENHDQVANSGRGQRIHHLTSPGRLKALTALMLLAPGTPMLFQGQEFASSAPFLYFADHHPELAARVAKGRAEFLAQFPNLSLPETQATLSDPSDVRIFEKCKLDFSERRQHAKIYDLHRDLLKLRRNDPVFGRQRPGAVDGAVLGSHAFVLRFFAEDQSDRLLLINLGRDLPLNPAPEPLLAPPLGNSWAMQWSSDDVRYGGCGTPHPETEENWLIPGEAAVVLLPQSKDRVGMES